MTRPVSTVDPFDGMPLPDVDSPEFAALEAVHNLTSVIAEATATASDAARPEPIRDFTRGVAAGAELLVDVAGVVQRHGAGSQTAHAARAYLRHELDQSRTFAADEAIDPAQRAFAIGLGEGARRAWVSVRRMVDAVALVDADLFAGGAR